MFFDQTFTIYHDNGGTTFVDNMYAFIQQNGGVALFCTRMKFNISEYNKRIYNPSNYYGYNSSNNFWHIDNHIGYFVCSENGMMISPDLMYSEFTKVYNEYWSSYFEKRSNFRKHNNPWKNKHSNTRYKHPQTMNTRRSVALVLKEEGEPEFRGKRKIRSIPTLWDDKKTRHSTGWKYSSKRKHQYKGS